MFKYNFFFNIYNIQFLFILTTASLISVLGIFFFDKLIFVFCSFALFIYIFFIINFFNKLEQTFFFYSDNSRIITLGISFIFFFSFFFDNTVLCTNNNNLQLNNIEIQNMSLIKQHLIDLNKAGFNTQKNAYIDTIRSSLIFTDDLMLHSGFSNYKEALTEQLVLFQNLNMAEIFVTHEIFNDINISNFEQNNFSLLGFEGFLREINNDFKLEINLHEFRGLKSFLSFQSFSDIWGSTNLNNQELHFFFNDCGLNNYPILHINCIKYQKFLNEYIIQYNELISMHNSLLSINPEVIQDKYSTYNIFQINNPNLKTIKLIKNYYSQFLN